MNNPSDPLTQAALTKLLSEIDAHDGFRVKRIDIPETAPSLVLCFYNQGTPHPIPWAAGNKGAAYMDLEPYAAITGKPQEPGYLSRMQLFVEAACRFLNTGGSIDEAMYYVRQLNALAHRLEFHIPDYELEDSFLDSEGVYVHIFSSPKTDMVIEWAEDISFDVVTGTEYDHGQAEQDDDTAQLTKPNSSSRETPVLGQKDDGPAAPGSR